MSKITPENLDFDLLFANSVNREDIEEDTYLQGWYKIVGGINGIPTVRQFNALQYISDLKSRYLYHNKLDKNGGEADELVISFLKAAQRENIKSGENLKEIMGKICKYFEDLKDIAFTAKYTDLTGTPSELKNPKPLEVKLDGTEQYNYDGSMPKTLNFIAGKNITLDLDPNGDLTINSEDNSLVDKLIDKFYPIGTVYASVKDVSPESFLGGKWERFAEGRTTIGVDPNNSNYNTAGKTGGSATTQLNISNMPAHTHNYSWTGKPSGSASTGVSVYDNGNHIHTAGSLTANDTSLTGYVGNIVTERESGLTCSGVFSQRTSVSSSRYGGGTQSNKAPDFADFNATHGHSLRGNTEWGGQHGHTAAATTILNFNNMIVAGNTSSAGTGVAFNNIQPYVTEYKWVRVA